jgi:hypothetical protein
MSTSEETGTSTIIIIPDRPLFQAAVKLKPMIFVVFSAELGHNTRRVIKA